MKCKGTYLGVISWCLILLVLCSPDYLLAGPKDTVRVGLYTDPQTVNAFQLRAVVDDVPISCIHQGLMKIDEKTGEYALDLAESVKILENKKDIMVKLRKGPKFHTGDPVTAHDVRFTWQQHMDPQIASIAKSIFDRIKDIEVVDDYTLIYRYKTPFAPWRDLAGYGISSKRYFEKVGREKALKEPVGSGPFRFVKRIVGEKIILEAVPNHHDYKVDFKTLELVTVPDELTRTAMLETGELDLAYMILPHQVRRLEQNKRIKVKRSATAPSLFVHDFLLATKGIKDDIKDVKLRLAFQHAINRQEIVDKVFFGEGYPLYMYAGKNELGYDPTLSYVYDPELARKLIKESDYKGQTLQFTYTSEVQHAATIAAYIQKYMKDVGVNLEIRQFELGSALDMHAEKNPKLGHHILWSWSLSTPDPIKRLMISVKSDGYFAIYPDRPTQAHIDKLVYEQASELDERKRKTILKKIHGYLRSDPEYTPLFGLNMIYAMSDRIDYTWPTKSRELTALHNIKILH